MVPQPPLQTAQGEVQQPHIPEPDPVNDKIFEQTNPLGSSVTKMLSSGSDAAFRTYSDIASEPLGLSQDTQDSLKKAGWFNDYAAGEDSWSKSILEGLIKPAAAGLDALVRGPYALGTAAVAGVGNLFAQDTPDKASQQAQDVVNSIMISSGFAEDGMPLIKNSTIKGSAKVEAETETVASASNGPAQAAKNETPSVTMPITTDTMPADKAGNINLDRINAPEDVKDLIRKVADDNGGDNAFIDQRRGVVTHQQTLSAADGLLVNWQVANGVPDWMADWQVGEAPNNEQAAAARMVMASTSTEALRLQKIAKQSGAEADMNAWREATAQHILAQNTVAGMAAESGRTLNSFSITVPGGEAADVLKKIDLNGMTEKQLFNTMSGMDTAQSMAKLVEDSRKPTFGDGLIYYIINNYLSGPITHAAYAASFHVGAILRVGMETPIASLVGKAQSLAGKALSTDEVSSLQMERTSLANSIAQAESKTGLSMTVAQREVMKLRMSKIDEELSKGVTVMPKETVARFYGMGQGYLDAVKASWKALKTGDMQWLPSESREMDVTNPALTFGRNPIVNYGRSIENPVLSQMVQGTGKLVGVPSRFVGAIHTYQKFLSYSESLNALSYRQAAAEGLEGNELGARIAQLKNDPTPEIMQGATSEAKYAALMGEPGKAGKNFEKWANSNNYTKALVPFSRVMNNINSQAFLERTPLGAFSDKVRADIMGRNGNAAQATAIGKMATGVTVLGGAATYAAQGLVTGQAADDKSDQAFNYLSGTAPYTVRIGEMNVPLKFFGIAGRVMALGADFHDVSQAAYKEDDLTAAIGAAAHAVGHDILDESGFRGIAELFQAVDDYERYGKKYASNAMISAFDPYSVGQGQVARFIDPDLRQAQGFLETLKSRTPFLSEMLVPRIDIFGNPISRNSDHSWAESDPVMQAMSQVEFHPGAVGTRLSNIKLSEEEYNDYATKAGKLFYLDAQRKVTDPSWVKLSPSGQLDILQTSLDDARGKAKEYMHLAYPELAKKSAKENISLATPAGSSP